MGKSLIKFRKIYDLKGVKRIMTLEGTNIWYMRKPRVWKTVLLS